MKRHVIGSSFECPFDRVPQKGKIHTKETKRPEMKKEDDAYTYFWVRDAHTHTETHKCLTAPRAIHQSEGYVFNFKKEVAQREEAARPKIDVSGRSGDVR